MVHPKRAVTSLLLIFATMTVVGCGGDDDSSDPPFVVQVQPLDVLQPSVQEIQVILRPVQPDRHFEGSERSYEGGARSFVSSAGEYVLSLSEAWVDKNSVTDPETLQSLGVTTFILDVPLQAGGPPATGINEVELIVDIKRDDNVIARGGSRVAWPLLPGVTKEIAVSCIRPMFSQQCTTPAQ